MSRLTDQPFLNRRYLLRWLLIIFIIKAALFVFFATQFYQYAKSGLVTSLIVVEQADTQSYYNPAKAFFESGVYDNMCRMPGLVPVYSICALVLGRENAMIGIVILQFLFSVLSALLLAIISSRIIPHRNAFPLTALLYSLSSFVSIWDHTTLSDSFSVSFLIISVYCLTEYSVRLKLSWLLLAGFWLAWSIFIRQIGIVFIPLFAIMMWVWTGYGWLKMAKRTVVLVAAPIILIVLWTIHNYQRERIVVPLILPIADCWQSYTPQFMRINQLLIAWGEDVQYWIADSPSAWFNSTKAQQQTFPFREALYTNAYNADSVLLLQHRYVQFKATTDPVVKQQLGDAVLLQCDKMISAYKTEKPFGYYVINRLKMVKDFVFPARLDNTPGPPFGVMLWWQKAVKAGYYLLLLVVNFLAMWSIIIAALRRNWNLLALAMIPIALVFVLAYLMGYIEQRYLVPAYPFFIVLDVWLMTELGVFFKRKMATQ